MFPRTYPQDITPGHISRTYVQWYPGHIWVLPTTYLHDIPPGHRFNALHDISARHILTTYPQDIRSMCPGHILVLPTTYLQDIPPGHTFNVTQDISQDIPPDHTSRTYTSRTYTQDTTPPCPGQQGGYVLGPRDMSWKCQEIFICPGAHPVLGIRRGDMSWVYVLGNIVPQDIPPGHTHMSWGT